jgi:hypothetical protein
MSIFKFLKNKKIEQSISVETSSEEEMHYEQEKTEWLNKVPDCNSTNENQNRELRSLFGFQADLFKICTGKKLWEQDRWKRE